MAFNFEGTSWVSWIEDLHLLILLHVGEPCSVGAPSEAASLISGVGVDHGSLLVLHIPDSDSRIHTTGGKGVLGIFVPIDV